MRGGLIRKIAQPSGITEIVWNGNADNGRIVSPGNYIKLIVAGKLRMSEQFLAVNR
ncbi:MAG: hypothetical protein JW913_19505 [Chitinispirillaceae bacterium]|nr:hypothetical protein [Chitinispirillaceae bacterium]